MSADQAWETQSDDVFNVVADIDRPSDRIHYAFLAGYQAADFARGAQQSELVRLKEQLKIAEDVLEHIVQIADRGAQGSAIGVYAHDALIRMSVVE